MVTPRKRSRPQLHPRSLEAVVGRLLDERQVEFIVLNLERDLEKGVFITAKLALEDDHPVVKRIYHEVRRFFERVDYLMTRGDAYSLALAKRMLSFAEPAENRLGYVQMGSRGFALKRGSRLGDYLYSTMLRRRYFRQAVASEPDTLCLQHMFALDRVSDIIVAIAKMQFVEFTQEMAKFYKFDPACMRDVEIAGPWDWTNDRWTRIMVRLPVDDHGRAILLTPKSICRSGPAMTASQYFRDLTGPSGAQPDEMTKQALMQHAEDNPGTLVRFAETRMKDPSKFKPRREYQRPTEKKKNKR